MTGPPDWLQARLHAVLAGLIPCPDAGAVVAAVAARHGRTPDEVLLTGGAADACRLIATTLRPRRAVCVYPLDSAPEAALRQAGHAVEQVKLAPPAALDPDQLPADADLVVLAHPGTEPTPAELIRRLARPGRILVADEALTDPPPGDEASLGGRRHLPGLIVVRGLAPCWGLAGLAAGYLLGDADTLGPLRDAQPAGLVSGLALAALEACSQPDAVAWADHQPTAGKQAPAARQHTATARDAAGTPGAAERQDTSTARDAAGTPGAAARQDTATARDPAGTLGAAERQDAAGIPGRAGQPPPLAAPGTVTLIGAGPGGPDLITMRGWRALHAADVVIADRLADPALTSQLRPGVRLIHAGKAPGAQQLSQDEINQQLVEHAAAGRRVVRLKGGDPFVLGRGGEEAAACAAAGIACSVIPGLSSATAGPTLAGIPLTHREVGLSFSVVSGHLPPGHPASRVDWAALAAGTDTLVLLMAVRNLGAIAARLIACGKPDTTPAACVENAGTGHQRVVRATLSELAGPAAPGVSNPAIIIIGATAGLPLAGL